MVRATEGGIEGPAFSEKTGVDGGRGTVPPPAARQADRGWARRTLRGGEFQAQSDDWSQVGQIPLGPLEILFVPSDIFCT